MPNRRVVKSVPVHPTLLRDVIALLKECYTRLECFDAGMHQQGLCLDERVKHVINELTNGLDK